MTAGKYHADNMTICSRRSVRRFRERHVHEELVSKILDAAVLAPSAHNRQPWLIGAIDDRSLLASIADLTPNGRFIQKCAVCFAVFCLREEKYWLEDGCAATMNIIHAANELGIGTCWVAGAKKEYAGSVRALLSLPEDYTLVSLVAAGYPASVTRPPKKKIPEVTFRNRYEGGASSFSTQCAATGRAPLKVRLRRSVRSLLLRYF